MCRRRAADRVAIGRPERAAAAVAAPAGRCSRAQVAVEGGSVRRGVSAVRGARRAISDGRGMLVRSRGGALAWVPVYSTYGGREIAAVRAPRRLRGSSGQVRAGVGVLAGRARGGWGGAGAS